MNRTLAYPNCARRRTYRRPTVSDWAALIILCIWQFFARRDVRLAMRMAAGGSAFVLMLAVVGGMEQGNVSLLPGAAICLGLVGLAFLTLRGLGADR